MKNSSCNTATASTGSKKKPAHGDHVLPEKSGSDPGTCDTPKADKGLPPPGATPALAGESGGSDVGTDDKINKGL